MAQADWKRYYVVGYDATPSFQPIVWYNRQQAYEFFRSEYLGWELNIRHGPKPICVCGVRGRAHNPELQRTLLELAR